MKEYTKESLVDAFLEIKDRGWIESGRAKNNAGAVGNTLEDLLGIDENNLPIPNAAEWELKAQRKNTSSLVTMFHSEPSPRAFRFVPSILLPKYGWKHQQAGNRYPETEMSFRQTINASMYSDRGFTVKLDREERKVIISFDASKVDPRHSDWIKNVERNVGLGELNPQPYWGFEDLFHKAGTKLHNCFLAIADRKRIDGVEYFKYDEIFILRKFGLDSFVNAIASGYIYVDFDARTGHNHGTKFRLRQSHFKDLYEEVIPIEDF